jgi:hypothetical protein
MIQIDDNALSARAIDPHVWRSKMKTVSIVACLLFASGAFAADCHTNLRGQTVCSNGQSAAAVNPSTGTVTTAQKSQSGVTTAQNSNGTKAAYNPPGMQPSRKPTRTG